MARGLILLFLLAGCDAPSVTGPYVEVSTTQDYDPLKYPVWAVSYVSSKEARERCRVDGCVEYMDVIGAARVVIDKDLPLEEMKPLIAHECQHLAWGPEHE